MRGLALLPVLLLAGASHAGLLTDDEAHKKIGELQQQNIQQQDKLDKRLSSLESTQRGQGMEMLSQMDALKTDQNKLRGQIEELTHEIETLQKRQRDLYVDVDTRLRQLESVAAAAPVAAENSPRSGKDKKAGGKTAAVPVPVPVAETASGASSELPSEGKAYDIAFNLFRAGNYQGAVTAFESFNQTYPKSPLASSAQYWVGNSHYNLKDYKAAIASQQDLIAHYPKSSKVPDAMLNIATCQQNLGDADASRKSLEDLVAKFPLSDAADKAKKRLASMK